jgi:hypothetical protein
MRALGRLDPRLRARRMILSSTSVMFCTYVTAKPRVRGSRARKSN